MNLFGKKLELVDLKIHEFMGAKGELFIDFSDTTEIIGDNGKGKSLILNAIAFLFCGTDAFGKKIDFSVHGTKEVYSYVEANVVIDGVSTLYKRTYKVNKKGSKSMAFWQNHLEIKQTAWGKNCDKDVFLSMINPKYLSSLKDSGLRNCLIKFIKAKGIDEKDILMHLDLDDIINLEDELSENNIDFVETTYLDNLKSIEALIKTNKNIIAELEKLEEPAEVNEQFIIDAKFFDNYEDAFEYVIGCIVADPVDKNIDLMKELNDMKTIKDLNKSKITNYHNKVKDIALLSDNNIKLIEEKEELTKVLKSIENFNKKIIVNLNLDKYIDNFKIQFKNVYGKDDFTIIYKDSPIDTCSYSEQVICGIKLTDYLMEQLGIDFPIFIDNAECITSFPELRKHRQLISMTVAKGFELSKYVGDKIVNLKTLETMPKIDKESLIVTRLLGGRFDLSE